MARAEEEGEELIDLTEFRDAGLPVFRSGEMDVEGLGAKNERHG